MIGLLIAAFEHLSGRAKGPGMKGAVEETKGNEVHEEMERSNEGEAKELSEKMKDDDKGDR